jgi:monoamine oxidase
VPRTPLLDRLGALARVARLADRTGVPVDELLDPALDPARPLSRRALLGYAAAGAGLAACGGAERLLGAGARAGAAAPARGGAGGPAVAVVGAGLAGLTCAYRLRAAGVNATLYEAQVRLGGRCRTRRDNTFLAGQLSERGGELIDQSHTAIRQLARELGLTLDNVLRAEPNGAEPLLHVGGAPYSARAAARDLMEAWPAIKRDYQDAGYPTTYAQSTPRGRALDATPLRDWIAATIPGGLASPLGRLLDVAYNIEYGAETADQSALNLLYLLGASGQGSLRLFGPSNEKYKVRGGNDLLVQGLAERVGDAGIRRGAALRAVRRAGARWTLAFDGAPDVTVDRVVLALPFTMLRGGRVDLGQANFPARKLAAVEQLGMGANCKLQLQFDRRHWHALGCGGDTFADTGYQATWEATRAQGGAPGILVNYTGGDVARAQGGRAPVALAREFLARAEPVLPGLGARWIPERVAFDDWPNDPWTRGSYSYWRVGQMQAIAGAEAEAVDGCHFAGEHTSIDAQGYLEGAVESGERAAREVLAGLGLVSRA